MGSQQNGKDTTDAQNTLRALIEKWGPENALRAADAVDVSREEVKKAQQRHPNHSDRLGKTFRHLYPSPEMLSLQSEVYRAHCRELLERAVRGDDLRPATNAELLCTLMLTIAKTPEKELVIAFVAVHLKVFGVEETASLAGGDGRWYEIVEANSEPVEAFLSAMRAECVVTGRVN